MAEDKCPTEEDYQQILERIRSNDESLTAINLNNLQGGKNEWMVTLVEELMSKNHNVEKLYLANCSITTEGGKKFAELINSSIPITELNLESNSIGPEGIKAISAAIETNTTLREIKLTNQSQASGNEAERALAKAVDANQVLQRCTIELRDAASRNTLDRAISRNREIARKARQAAKSK